MIDYFLSDLKFIISLIIGIIGIAFTIVLYFRGLMTKVPCYTRRGNTLIDSKLIENNPIKVTFLKKPVKILTITYLAFWNNGKATITRDDIAEADPVRIVANEGCDILAVDIVYGDKPPNNFKIEWPNNSAIINFDFIDYKNGVIIRVYHTGKDFREVDIDGTVKSVDGIINVDKIGELPINVFTNFVERIYDDIFSQLLFQLTPKWLLEKLIEFKARPSIQGFFSFLLFMIPLGIIMLPLSMICMLIIVILFPVSMVQFFRTVGRYNLPKELDVVMHFVPLFPFKKSG